MVSLRTLLHAALLGGAMARLAMPAAESLKSMLAARAASQQPLGSDFKQTPFSFSLLKKSYEAGTFTRIKQDGTTCPSYGEAQWTGTVDVSSERRLFYWFAESRNDPSSDPVILWMNGGPGASSLIGLFSEMGPCVLEVNATKPVPNPWAWNNNASVIFLDQPAGVGFSSVADGGREPSTDLDSAVDFQAFLNIFFQNVFPDKAHLPIYFAGESYGGHFVPTYTKYILDSRNFNSKDAFWGQIAGLIHVNALLEWTSVGVGAYELLCSDYRGRDFLEAEECKHIQRSIPELERLGSACRESGDDNICLAQASFFFENIHAIYYKRVLSGERNDHNINSRCVGKEGMCQDMAHGNYTAYLNRDHIKAAIGVPMTRTFTEFNLTIQGNYGLDFASSRTRILETIMDAPENSGLGNMRLLVLNGNEDYVVNTPGQQWFYDNLLWDGHAEYRIQKWRDLPEDVAATGFWKGTTDGRLVFVGLDGAGHEVPGFLPEASYRVLQRWIANEW